MMTKTRKATIAVAFLIGCKGAKTVGVDVLDDPKTNNSDQTIFVNDKRVAEDVDPYKIKSHSGKKRLHHNRIVSTSVGDDIILPLS